MPYLILSAIGPESPPGDNYISHYFFRANSWSTLISIDRSQLLFRALLTDGVREVRFERVAAG
jgi:hypothetical protein